MGAWLFISRIHVTAVGASKLGGVPTAWALLPLFAGVALLFWKARFIVGWLLLFAGFAWLLLGILVNANFVFRTTSMGSTVICLACLAGGLGLIFRALRSHTSPAKD